MSIKTREELEQELEDIKSRLAVVEQERTQKEEPKEEEPKEEEPKDEVESEDEIEKLLNA
jgi:hypothetical protein